MASWEPVDIDPADRDGIGMEDDKWDDGKINELEAKLEELRRFSARLEESFDKDEENNMTLEKCKLKEDTIELVTDQIYDKMTKLFNDRRKRLGIKGSAKKVEPVRSSDYLNLDDNGHLAFTYENDVKDLGNIDKDLESPSKMIKKLGVTRLKFNELYKHNR